jgi:hypothetical protein
VAERLRRLCKVDEPFEIVGIWRAVAATGWILDLLCELSEHGVCRRDEVETWWR